MTSPANAATAARSGTIAYWVTTVILAAVMTVGGVLDILRVDSFREIMEQQLGYPAYFSVILGVWKVSGVVVLLVPRLPRLKEWVYAGAVFNYTGAAASHLAVGDGTGALVPSIIAVIVFASWALRPPARRDLAPGSRILPLSFASR